MRKIIPLIILMLFSAWITKAQNLAPAEKSAALQLVDAHKAAIGITAEQFANSVVVTSYEDAATGIRYVGLQQTFKGIPVYNQVLVLAFRRGALVSRDGFFDPSMEKSVNVPSGAPAVSAESAVQSAISDRGFRASQMAVAINRKNEGRLIEFGNMGISHENITAQLTWVPDELTKTYKLSWLVYIVPKTTSDYWMVRVNAVDNSIIGMDNYTDYDHWGTPNENPNIKYPAFDYGDVLISKETATSLFEFKKITDDPSVVNTATYRVIPVPAESPLHPGGAPALRTDPWTAATANAVTLKWHTGAGATDYNYTRGNNVFAYHDRPNDNTGTPAEAATSTTALPNLTFDFVPDFTVDPTQTTPVPNQQFNITNLFYWNNVIHDVLYAYGFTEAGRNFQDDNMGRGGAGADWVRAEAQDGGGTNNANFSTPADGSLPRMQMYLWTAPTPDRDGDVDNGIIIHEYGHGVSNRSNAGGVGCLGNAEQAGEGWSDYLGLMLTQDWATATLSTGFNSPRGIGTYALNQPNNGPGIRPARYCTDFAVNNYTYNNIGGLAIPHGVGFLFCTMLWEMTWELINDIGTITPNIYNTAGTGGNVVALKLVMEGLRIQQCQPGFVSARNAILRADTLLFGGIYYCPIMRAFARRGVGVGALEGSTNSITDQTPSFVGGGPVMAFTQNGAGGIAELQNIIYNHAITAACSAITNYTLRDTLPTNVTFVSATNGGVYTAATRVVAWPVNIALNATQNYGLTVQINAGSYFPPVTLINEPVPTTTISGFWTTASTTANVWIAHNVRSKSAPNSFFTPDAAIVSDQTLATTASFALGATPPTLSFWHWYNSEATWDGGVLEISLNGGGSWADIGAANFTQNGYNGALNASASPLGGRAAWNGNSGAFVETKVNMAPYANQANVKLRWRFASDASVAATGWNVDDILLQTLAVVNLRSSLFNAANVRVEIRDTVTVILPGAAVPPTVTINQAVGQADPTSVQPINFTAVFDQPVIGFATGDVVLTGTAGATTGTVTGGPTTFNVAVTGMTSSGTVIATIPAGVCTNATLDPNVASTSTDNTVTYNMPPPPPGCITTVDYTGVPVVIPDGVGAGVNIPITVSGVGTISDLNFRITGTAASTDPLSTTVGLNHSWVGDLKFTLTSPAATTVTIFDRPGVPATTFGCNNNNLYNVGLDDDGGLPGIETQCDAAGTGAMFPAGNYTPNNPLSAFDGQNANGVWILNVSDNAGGDIGTLRAFSLVFTGVAPTINPRGHDTVCNNATAGPYNFTSPMPGTTFCWTNNNTSIGLGASGSGNIPAFTAVNAGTAPVTATVTVTPQISNPIALAGSLAAGDAVLTQRIFRDGIASTCAAPKPYPGTFATVGTYFYDSYSFTNTSNCAQCVTVTYESASTDQVHVTAYNGTFNPANQGLNYLADGGNSANGAGPVTFSFMAPAGATIVFIATEPISGQTNPAYTINIAGLQICAGAPMSFNIRVNPSGQVNPIANQVVCRGQTTAPVNFTSTVPGTIFSWTNNNTTIGLGAAGFGNIPAFVAQNATGVAQVATITVTPAYGSGGVPVTTNFNYTGAVQTWAVPAGVTSVTVKAWGAQGNSSANGVLGGLGGYAEGVLAVTPGQTLFVNVGGGGTATVSGGFNGGGAAGANAGCAGAQGGGGGGASDVRVAVNTLAARAIVGAGGGGAGGNRVANCGRGAGGGGGAGYYGGGGGAGWPGIPGSQGPVPTGGTQAAGGAGGQTTFSPGPTNGFNGALGVGGAGGTEIGSAQGGSATAEPGGGGGGLTGAPGNYNQANNWTGQSGAGGSSYIGGVSAGLTTTGVQSGNGRVEFTYAAGGISCPGTPRTFTITVNPNQDLIIVADPGTTICEGDPTLLTVYNVGASTPPGNLYVQTGAQVNGSPSQVFEPANAAFTSQAADDFVVPAGATWTVTGITANGIGTGSPTSVNVFFYANTGGNLPGAAIASHMNLTTFVRTGGNYNVTIPATTLGAGTYWMSFQVNMSFATGGQWFWGNYGAPNVLSEYAWQNPGGGFATPCTSWGYGGTGCNVGGGANNRNNIFSIIGSSVTPGTIATGTFLWSPAAGLSSTTSNPVAASPMNTTTYTVTRTTVPGGCVASAQITITVNKRPTVTTHPVSRANCEGTSATFTVAGTGTNLTYQWQVSTTGCAGPWTNLTNTAPYSGVTTPTLNVAPVTVAMNGYVYRAVLSGSCAAILTNNISNCATLTVNPNPPVTVTPVTGCGGVAGVSGLLLTASGANTYTWTPTTGLYTNSTTTIPYTGGNSATVYAAPTVFTVYTVTGTFTATGCFSSASAFVNYTPPAPTVTPSSVTMCLGDPAVRLIASTATPFTATATTGTISVPVPDNTANGITSALSISGIPAGATITSMTVALNMPHTYPADMIFNLQAPNGQILNLYKHNTNTDNGPASIPTAGFYNAVVSSAATTQFVAVPNPFRYGQTPPAGPYRADALNGVTNPGYPVVMDPAGYVSNAAGFASLYSVPNGTYTLAMADGGPADLGTFQGWTITINYLVGVPATRATWSPIAGLFNDAAATIPYTGDARDTVWTRPTPSGVYTYTVTAQSLPAAPVSFANTAPITINAAGPGAPYPSNIVVSGLPPTGVSVRSVTITGLNHTWSEDVDIVLRSPGGQNVILISDIDGAGDYANHTYTLDDAAATTMAGAAPPPSGTYRPTNSVGAIGVEPDNWPAPGPGTVAQPTPTLATFTGNMNGTWSLYAFDDAAGDAGSISGGYSINFNLGIQPCTSPARTVVVTVNQPTTITTQPVAQTVCTDKVATFSVVAAGTGPFSYQWQVSTNGNNPPWANVQNGGVYSGANTSTLTITAPPVSMNGYYYRVYVNGAAPCRADTSFGVRLTVNPLPTIVISAAPYTSLFPGLQTTITSTVTPVAGQTFTWIRNGVPVGGNNTGTINVDVDNLGTYQLRVTDVNGCTNLSNIITIKDSASGKCFIYPNPTSGKFQVRYHSVANNILPRTLTIYDSKGDRVMTQVYTIGRPYDRMDVDMRAMGKGLYWVEIGDRNGNRLTMCRVVIQ